jgi:hypothetical protein
MASVADPTAVGTMLLAARAAAPDERLSELADRLPWSELPRFNPGDSIAQEAARAYHAELEERSAAGDRYATSMLKGHAYQEPSDAS